MEIRVLDREASHFDVVVRWVFDEWNPISPFETLTSTRLELSQRTEPNSPPLAYVAQTSSGHPLGTVSLIDCDYPPRDDLTPWVADMYVAPDHRKQGIGSALIRHLERQAKAAGIASLYLITRNQRHFYEQLGWKMLDQLHYQSVVAVLMQRDL